MCPDARQLNGTIGGERGECGAAGHARPPAGRRPPGYARRRRHHRAAAASGAGRGGGGAGAGAGDAGSQGWPSRESRESRGAQNAKSRRCARRSVKARVARVALRRQCFCGGVAPAVIFHCCDHSLCPCLRSYVYSNSNMMAATRDATETMLVIMRMFKLAGNTAATATMPRATAGPA